MKSILRNLDLPPFWGLACLIGIVGVNIIAPNPNIANLWTFLLGLIALFGAAFLLFWARRSFHQYETTIHPKKLPTTLMTKGVFGVSRNPIYLAFLLVVFGVALILGSLWGFLFVILLFFVLRYRFISHEEVNLLEIFGEEAKKYMIKVRRWF